MAATLEWYISDNSVEDYRSLPSETTSPNTIRFKNANNNINDTNDPMIRPSTGWNYSFEKAMQIWVTVQGGASSLSTLRVRVSTNDIQLSAGGSANVVQAYDFRTAYTQPQQYSGGSGGVGGPMPAREGPLTTTTTDWTRAGGALGAHSLFTSLPRVWEDATGVQDHLYMQLEVGTGSGGTLTAWQSIAVYNEV